MKLILLGAPGAGKGTQAVQIAKKYNIVHISTGDIFRKNLKEQTPIGKIAKSYIDKGQLVPDEVTVEIVKQRLFDDDVQNGYLLDGFPRNLGQAKVLETFASIDKVVNIDVDLSKLMQRLVGRRVCSKCGESYHVSTFSGDVCTKCGGSIFQRDDDKQETVSLRLDTYTKQTEPLIEYYTKAKALVTVDGMQSIEKVFADIVSALSK